MECGLDIRRSVVEFTHWCLLLLIGSDGDFQERFGSLVLFIRRRRFR